VITPFRNLHGRTVPKQPKINPTSFPGSLCFPPPGAGGGKKRDPGNEVEINPQKVMSFKSLKVREIKETKDSGN